MTAETGIAPFVIPLITVVGGLLSSAFKGQAATQQASLAARAQREVRDQQIAAYWAERGGSGAAPSKVPTLVLVGGVAVGAWLLWSVTRGD